LAAPAPDKLAAQKHNPCAHLPAVAVAHNPHCTTTHGGDPADPVDPLDPDASVERDAPDSVPPAPCPGDGVSGKRVQVLYAYPAGTANRIDERAAAIRTRVDRADYYLAHSVAGGDGSHIRWLCKGDKVPKITPVQVKAIGPDSIFTFADMTDSLLNQVKYGLGPVDYAAPDRIYLVVVDHILRMGAYRYGGEGTLLPDDQPDPATNMNNDGSIPRYALVAQLNGLTALHELGHNIGAVQDSAPHSSLLGHCYERRDAMCYQDGGDYFKLGGTMIDACPEKPTWWFDCGKDDYYNLNPAPDNYLATHWNTANSGWLTRPGKG